MTFFQVAAFTPQEAALGGALIGASAVLLMASLGRIAGISGMLSKLLPPYEDAATPIRAAFVAGLLSAPVLALIMGPAPGISITTSTGTLVTAGLLVGFGSVLGSGCTSGHGVCGMARLSPRSIVATLVFMAAAIATTFVVRHGLTG